MTLAPLTTRRTVLRDRTISAADYACPCGTGVITVADCTVHAQRTHDAYELPQQAIPCPECGATDPTRILDYAPTGDA